MNNEIEIKDLNEINKNNKQQVVYRKDNLSTDCITGEVIERNQIIVRKVQTRESFIKLFTENIHYIINLEPQEKTLFFTLLSSVDYKNVVRFDKSMKQNIILDKVLSRAGMYRALNGLIEKKVIFKIDRDFVKSYAGVGSDDCYLFNPNLVGRGSWNDLKNLRHTITREWDFENLEVRENLEIEEEYLGLDEIKNNQKQYQVKEINQEHDETTKVKNTEIVIEEKNNSANNQYSFDKKEEPSINKKVLISNDTQPSLFNENQKEQEARLFIEKFGGMFSGAYHPTKSAKELKREKLDQDLKEGKI
ncbi:hypothetical protein D9Y79_07575 [Campylobacter coli]|uniref:Plasmid replication protein RepL domain-containing protein n=1 Tax=Campylobacter coli TaxID=195 RepID=A0A5Z1RUU2_CAMCO|nr:MULTISPECIES: hypothetical protein [Campylobacter]EIA87653.1 hypothetical protein cco7_05842 [Campylobacter coli 67-8]EAH4682386.1 hypothetical protein [Campylobacter coli]EAH5011979.1 hypothetical protein [Campylobacter coli]EAH5015242.1 hypothetical protein [Campylobacter coli]EAH5172014.1 hypothetical protein [Campylobacter coli]